MCSVSGRRSACKWTSRWPAAVVASAVPECYAELREERDDCGLSFLGGHRRSGRAVLVGEVRVGTGLEQQPHDAEPPLARRVHQRRAPVVGLEVHVETPGAQPLDDLLAAIERGLDEGVLAVLIHGTRVATAVEQAEGRLLLHGVERRIVAGDPAFLSAVSRSAACRAASPATRWRCRG